MVQYCVYDWPAHMYTILYTTIMYQYVPGVVPEGDRNGRPMLQADWLGRGVREGSSGVF